MSDRRDSAIPDGAGKGDGSIGARSDPGAGDQDKGLRRFVDRIRSIWRQRSADHPLQTVIEELISEPDDRSPGARAALAHERTLLVNILKLRDLTAYDVMVPRADIKAIEESVSLDDLVQAILKEAHSRLPVYRETLDNVLGMVHIKDVLASVGKPSFALGEILRKVLFVAPSMRVLDLLLQMRLSRTHLALVVDEYGGIDGLVTIEDLVETIVGEIEDEHDDEEPTSLTRAPDGSVIAAARLPLADFEARFGKILTDEERAGDIDTLGGLIVSVAGRVPARGELVSHPSGLVFEIIEADPRRVKRARVRGLRMPADAGPPVAEPHPEARAPAAAAPSPAAEVEEEKPTRQARKAGGRRAARLSTSGRVRSTSKTVTGPEPSGPPTRRER
ncbi:MAG: HlyC/CorC family transporter [Alphaproteobacteria bacterium]|nr:HlyC/CorC family transporter [Alphaproteobacteria bacterium]